MARLTAQNRKWWILATMTGALSMILIDETVVGIALPVIQRDLHVSQAGLPWVVNACLLALASCVAVGGRLGELLGQARMFRLGALVFVAASAGCGLARSPAWIIAARAVQGLGWRAVFWVNLPLGLSVLALAAVTLPADEPERGAGMDWCGALTLVPGLVMIVLALMQGRPWGWKSTMTITLLAAGAVLIAVFALAEPRRRSPLVPLALLRRRNFPADNAVLALVQFALTGLTVFAAIYVQELLGLRPVTAGLSLLPVMVPLLVLSPLAGRIYDRAGPRALVSGGAALLRHVPAADAPPWRLVPAGPGCPSRAGGGYVGQGASGSPRGGHSAVPGR